MTQETTMSNPKASSSHGTTWGPSSLPQASTPWSSAVHLVGTVDLSKEWKKWKSSNPKWCKMMRTKAGIEMKRMMMSCANSISNMFAYRFRCLQGSHICWFWGRTSSNLRDHCRKSRRHCVMIVLEIVSLQTKKKLTEQENPVLKGVKSTGTSEIYERMKIATTHTCELP